MEDVIGKVVYTQGGGRQEAAPVVAAARSAPAAQSKQAITSLTFSRNRFIGFWRVLQQYGHLKTKDSRQIGGQGIPGACSATLRHQMAGLAWQVLTDDGEETAETEYFTLLLENAKDSDGNVIGAAGLFDLLAQDILNGHEGGNVEVVRLAGRPVGLFAIDCATLVWWPRRKNDPAPIAQVDPLSGRELVRFAQDEIMHLCWSRYAEAGRQWYNRHPVQMAWVAINCLSAGDDYTYSLLTEVIPQGLLNLGPEFTREKALAWKADWDKARAGGKLDDIGLLYGSSKVDFVRFQEIIKDQPFQHASYWYLTLVTAAHEMSPLDLGFMTQLNTKAGAEVSLELSQNKGLRHLLKTLSDGVETWILPEGLQLTWPDLDPTDEVKEATARKLNAEALSTATGGKAIITQDEARVEAQRLAVFEVSGPTPEELKAEQPAPEEQGQETDEEKKEKQAEKVAKSHSPEKVVVTCPLCGHGEAFDYPGHGGWLVCAGCGKAYHPEAYQSEG